MYISVFNVHFYIDYYWIFLTRPNEKKKCEFPVLYLVPFTIRLRLLLEQNLPFPIAQENSAFDGNLASLYLPLMALAHDVHTIISRITAFLSEIPCTGTSAK